MCGSESIYMMKGDSFSDKQITQKGSQQDPVFSLSVYEQYFRYYTISITLSKHCHSIGRDSGNISCQYCFNTRKCLHTILLLAYAAISYIAIPQQMHPNCHCLSSEINFRTLSIHYAPCECTQSRQDMLEVCW